MWKIILTKKIHDDLRELLFSTVPEENGCFLLANAYMPKKGKPVLLVTGIIAPDVHSWKCSGNYPLELTSSFINRAVAMAEENNSSLIFVHTHPGPSYTLGFSKIDKKSNEVLFENLSNILSDVSIGSMVINQQRMHGVIHDKGKVKPISTISVSGHTMFEVPISDTNSKSEVPIDEKFDRQMRAIGKDIHQKLEEMTITVVGCGGTGSPLAVQLARMGVGKLRLVDHDTIEKSNLPRVYGATEKDCKKHKLKAEILKKHIKTFSKTEIEVIPKDVTQDDVLAELVDSNVIFACTDNLTSRAKLNRLSIEYCMPLIDVGCRIDLNDDDTINEATIKVQVVTPDNACLWCSGALDGKIILQESLSKEEKKELEKNGYYQDVEKQPSIIYMTTMAASLAIHKLLCLLGRFGNEYPTRSRIELNNCFMVNDTPNVKPGCICQKLKGLAGKRMEVKH